MIEILDDGDAFAQIGQKNGCLRRAVAAAHHGHILALVKRAVTQRAVGYAVASQLLLACHAQRAVLGAGGQDDGLGRVFALAGGGDKAAVLQLVQGGDILQFDFQPQIQRLAERRVGQLIAAHAGHTGIVFYPWGGGDLSAEGFLFGQQHAFACAQGIDGGG